MLSKEQFKNELKNALIKYYVIDSYTDKTCYHSYEFFIQKI